MGSPWGRCPAGTALGQVSRTEDTPTNPRGMSPCAQVELPPSKADCSSWFSPGASQSAKQGTGTLGVSNSAAGLGTQFSPEHRVVMGKGHVWCPRQEDTKLLTAVPGQILSLWQ